MSYLSTPRPLIRNIIKRAYSARAGEIEAKSTCFNPENPPTFSNGLVSRETLEKFHPQVGNRDVVGFGWNGRFFYRDALEFPYPSIRFKENTPDFLALRAKERDSWATLSVADKKALYRSSFCNTCSELRAPTGYKKDYVTSMLVMTTLTLLITLYLNDYGLPYMPVTYTRDWEMEVQRRRLLLAHDDIEYNRGYNYETNKWEK